jgi:type VI secretion system protein ImpC
VQSCHKPRIYDNEAATANARLATFLPYLLVGSRIFHYLKAIIRDQPGRFLSRTDCEVFLNQWIANYVAEHTASLSESAKYPLREGRVEVREIPGKPGLYAVTMYLRPEYPFCHADFSLRLETELGPV